MVESRVVYEIYDMSDCVSHIHLVNFHIDPENNVFFTNVEWKLIFQALSDRVELFIYWRAWPC